VHKLVKNCHSDSDFLVLLLEGKFTHPNVDIGVCSVFLSSPCEVSDIGEGPTRATLASSDGFLAAHELPQLLLCEHHVHGVLEADFDVLIGVRDGANTKPLLEKLLVHVRVPVSVGFSHPVLHLEGGLDDLISLVLGAGRVGGDGAASSAMVELDVDTSLSSDNIIPPGFYAFLGLGRSVARLATGLGNI